MSGLNAIIENFEKIKEIRLNIFLINQKIKQKLDYLNKIYNEFVKTHLCKEYIFGLDSFYFQIKLIELDYENMNKLLNTITNRIYCEYYKLYKTIELYIVSDINDIKMNELFTHKSFPIYKDLDTKINYDFTVAIELQCIIINCVIGLNEYLHIKKNVLKDDTQHSSLGFHIENIVNYQHFSNALLNERIWMFIRYLETLNKHHFKYFNRLFNSSKNIIDSLDDDIIIKQINNGNNSSLTELSINKNMMMKEQIYINDDTISNTIVLSISEIATKEETLFNHILI